MNPTTPATSVELAGCCGWCGGYHSGSCPKVKAIEYHPNGSVKRVEFHGSRPRFILDEEDE